MTKHSSGIIYKDIVFIDRAWIEGDLFIYAEWDFVEQHIHIYTGTWKQECQNDDEYVDRLIYIITHEVLHSEIEYAIAGEEYGNRGKNDEFVYDEHYPYLNGMDERYAQELR